MKMYIIVRSDLEPGAQGTQAAHALRLFAHEHPVIDQYWYEKSNNLVLLSVPNEAALKHLASRAADANFACSLFCEPDLDNSLTAIALEPDARKLVSNLPCMLRRSKKLKEVA